MSDVLANRSAKDRRKLDYYPTPPEVTHALMQFLNLQPTSVWECACGEGHMAEVIAEYGHNVISTDIRETGYGSGGRDFLLEGKLLAPVIITNPPFQESEAFIRHSTGLGAEVTAMLLKSQYWHAAKRAKLFAEHPPAWVLPLTWRPDFLFGEKGGAPTMEVLWTVWIRGQTDTRYRVLAKPI
ncbi:hypothetical protein QO009_003011 [Brevibacillus aydinogluensis]|jgi:hypothetical protein|uniref:SAM-dependent DNA methyltransferase n=1 Tax=Brevibacillus aydinogluensis TaxID=927786 RepID=UPI0028933789|nr:SAM-dependent DNA methyltransferase [Brevibacillus aydinogluensis]MDT3417116.1 hypothetical protein [Brevibacillus aydinogluensis]